MNKRIAGALLLAAIMLTSTLLAFFFSGGLFVLAATIFQLGERGLPEIIAPVVVSGGTLTGFGAGIAWARSVAR